MVWSVEIADHAERRLRTLDAQARRRILDRRLVVLALAVEHRREVYR